MKRVDDNEVTLQSSTSNDRVNTAVEDKVIAIYLVGCWNKSFMILDTAADQVYNDQLQLNLSTEQLFESFQNKIVFIL